MRPVGKRLVVFQVEERSRLKSGIYVGNPRRGSLSRTEDVWILAIGPDVVEPLKVGDHCFLHDGFELDPTNLDLWPLHCERPEFQSLRDFVAECEGTVVTKLVAEGSLLAVEDRAVSNKETSDQS
jgi:hypothetical protein